MPEAPPVGAISDKYGLQEAAARAIEPGERESAFRTGSMPGLVERARTASLAPMGRLDLGGWPVAGERCLLGLSRISKSAE